MDPDPVTQHFESVADSCDEVIPFFASFAETAVDSAPRMVELVRRDLPDVEAHVMTAQRLLLRRTAGIRLTAAGATATTPPSRIC